MKNVIIVEFSNPSSTGITLHLNRETTLKTGKISTDEFWISWDKIGKLLFDNYTEDSDVDGIN